MHWRRGTVRTKNHISVPATFTLDSKGAYMLEEKEERLRSLFSASVGNLPAGKAVLVTLTYVTELEFEDGRLRFVLPVQPYAPRASAGGARTKFMTPVSSEFLHDVPYGLAVRAEVRTRGARNGKWSMTRIIHTVRHVGCHSERLRVAHRHSHAK